MNEIVERVEDRLADFTRDRRVIVLSWMALIIGVLSALVAYALVWLIASITNLAFYQRFSPVFQSPDQHPLGNYVIFVPAIGGLIIGFMARYGSEKFADTVFRKPLKPSSLVVAAWSLKSPCLSLCPLRYPSALAGPSVPKAQLS